MIVWANALRQPEDDKLGEAAKETCGMTQGTKNPNTSQSKCWYSVYVPSVSYILSIMLAYCVSTALRFNFLVGVSWFFSSEKFSGKMQNFWILKALFNTNFALLLVWLIASRMVSIHT